MFPPHPFRLIALLAAAILLQAGCASGKKKKEEKPAPAGPQPALVGTISLVNPESGFVLIDNGFMPSPMPDTQLRSFTNGVQSAELTSSHVRKRPFVIADIKGGTPRKGDKVFTAVGANAPIAPAIPPAAVRAPQPQEPDFLPAVQLSAP